MKFGSYAGRLSKNATGASAFMSFGWIGVVQILVFQAYMVSLYLHFIAFDFLYVVEFSRSRI